MIFPQSNVLTKQQDIATSTQQAPPQPTKNMFPSFAELQIGDRFTMDHFAREWHCENPVSHTHTPQKRRTCGGGVYGGFFYRAQTCTKLRKFQRNICQKKSSKYSSPILKKICPQFKTKISPIFWVFLNFLSDMSSQRPRHRTRTIARAFWLKLQFFWWELNDVC